MAVTHLGHDCIVGNHCILANGTGLAGHVILEDWVTLGGQCGVAQFVRVGAHSYIGGQSGVEKSVSSFLYCRRLPPDLSDRRQYCGSEAPELFLGNHFKDQ